MLEFWLCPRHHPIPLPLHYLMLLTSAVSIEHEWIARVFIARRSTLTCPMYVIRVLTSFYVDVMNTLGLSANEQTAPAVLYILLPTGIRRLLFPHW